MDDFTAARRAMVLNQLRPQGVTNLGVLAAMGTVAREAFVPQGLQAAAYGDRSLVLDGGAPMMPPAELGILLNALEPMAGEKALVIGEGGAYSAAVLEALGLDVTRTDAEPPLGRHAFDVILIEGSVGALPDWVVSQLAPGGRVGAAILDRGVSRLCIGRGDRGAIGFKSLADSQVPPLPAFQAKPQFTF
ncbi:protein-L-isoaspartate O-methyltransferase [Sphingomonas sp. HDW15A]|uniref:protein-L-isoaspartate O-methyltransferase family protein n=1 Tax=Sphingomonas sp. HDW15A TaxID=2714942 RepID=UPI001F0D28E5|nr:protein-L-isoaspartate O-methyltransferase [Sphingomonas sp. HDW15A]